MGYSKYFSILGYYEKVVEPINNIFRVSSSGKMVCPLHSDTDPSLGIVKRGDDEFFHCFGCNAYGDVVDLHISVARIYFKRYLDRDMAIDELCSIFGVSRVELPKEEGTLDKYTKHKNRVLNSLTMREYKDLVAEGKILGEGLNYFNTLMLKVIEGDK